MFHIQWFITRLLKPIVSLILVIILVVNYPSTVLAQTNPFQNIWERIRSLPESLQTRTQGAPVAGRQKAGAGRGRCPALIPLDEDNEIPLTAFVPAIQEEQPTLSNSDNVSPSKLTYVWGRTIEQYPTFWFYIPYGSEESKTEYGKFVLLDKDKHIISGQIFVKIPIGNNPSLAKFTLPKSENPLEINQEYNWYFSIVCNPLKPSRNPGVTGWIERVNLPSFSLGNYRYYAEKGIWYDTVTRFVESADPQTLSQQLDWLLLIKFVFRNVENVEDVSMNDNDFNQIVNKIANFPIQTLTPVPNPELQR
ncbi:DUF928 domain-containing protein [Brasilonema bromeliae]|uniref:DUF928 domain-containing protein n=1 Tax=Brasilonema bromeliae SPC951 TaxID=385972 RepID=A0ABX1P7K6_9CYAN|nr:DUF928 domain-containing protein [Brasilonema bromeliae]NMG19968.1 hypothetical protein [Brasilonema bromeliae SPC951]